MKSQPSDSRAGASRITGGPKDLSVSKIMPIVYDELRRVARGYLRRERMGQSLQATALVHEAYLRLKKDGSQAWQNRAHFCAIAAASMRQILIERARARQASKRGGSRVRVTLDDAFAAADEKTIDLLAFDEALSKLETLDPQQARIVELRFFGGLAIEEISEALGISRSTVKRDWSMARAWLKKTITSDK